MTRPRHHKHHPRLSWVRERQDRLAQIQASPEYESGELIDLAAEAAFEAASIAVQSQRKRLPRRMLEQICIEAREKYDDLTYVPHIQEQSTAFSGLIRAFEQLDSANAQTEVAVQPVLVYNNR